MKLQNLPAMRETQVKSLGWQAPLEKRMSTHSSILAWRIPWTEEPGRLQFMGLQGRMQHIEDDMKDFSLIFYFHFINHSSFCGLCYNFKAAHYIYNLTFQALLLYTFTSHLDNTYLFIFRSKLTTHYYPCPYFK